MLHVSPNLTKTLSLTLDMVTALEMRDYDKIFEIDQKRQLYCHKDVDFDHFDWIKFKLVKRIQESLIDQLINIKELQEIHSSHVKKNLESIQKGYFM